MQHNNRNAPTYFPSHKKSVELFENQTKKNIALQASCYLNKRENHSEMNSE